MPKIITSVNWSAQNVPSGLSFDPQTGSFSGTPVGTGEYTIPVTVQTNYGKDTKDVILDIVHTYPVYVIGTQAETWSEGAEVDEYGFRQLNMPEVYKLEQHPLGFGAKTASGEYYACGVSGIANSKQTDSTKNIVIKTVPGLISPAAFTLDSRDSSKKIDKVVFLRPFYYHKWSAGTSPNSFDIIYTKDTVLYILRFTDGTFSYRENYIATYYKNNGSSASYGHPTPLLNNSNLPSSRIYLMAEPVNNPNYPYSHGCSVTPFVARKNNGDLYIQYLTYSNEDTSYEALGEKTLSCNPIKLFTGYSVIPTYATLSHGDYGKSVYTAPLFQYLSEDKLLDNDPSNFTLGTIKDAWVYRRIAYVITEDNELYEGSISSKTLQWVLHGVFNIKKLEIYYEKAVFFLTKDGKLYHKGQALSLGELIIDEHTEFTQIFPECYFHDFTFNGNTLTVLKE